MAVDLIKLQGKFEAILNDENFAKDFEDWYNNKNNSPLQGNVWVKASEPPKDNYTDELVVKYIGVIILDGAAPVESKRLAYYANGNFCDTNTNRPIYDVTHYLILPKLSPLSDNKEDADKK